MCQGPKSLTVKYSLLFQLSSFSLEFRSARYSPVFSSGQRAIEGGEDEDLKPSSRTPAPGSDISSKGSSTEEGHIRCLGIGADICIPTGDDKNKVNLNILFYELDKTLQSLKDENKQLRAEMEYLKELVKGGSIPKSAPAAPVQVQTVSSPQDGLEERLTSKIVNLESSFDKFKDEMNTKENESKTRIDSLTSSLESLVTRQSEHEDRFEKAFSNLSTAPAPAPAAQSEPESSSCDISAAPVDISEQLDTIKESLTGQVAACRALVASPLSVIFDAVRSEDWIGQDNFLPFTKLNVNIGGGMEINSGKFTAPVSGLYFFSLNVYGAPRDGVVLSIKANEFMEIASCSGVGKASQTCVVELDEKDTVGVYVNEKSKLTDTMNNRFTHFIGFLLRPKELMYM
ncbi:uncharacterized protein LOC111714261 [Eurytemora carolleeae]|uniref:uncharacterized protein LOC111714261 n=1 Tax=Eurytemora carolleeae TaxID=1294199 RepID=UPI000C7708BB|nr:uncharacterized protein LOC111714261 [Eurytemora carolleeae]|eukprot:XP_023345096.1 uncharacterized protein LOC111714261 [Eurytemora affinis]